MNSNIEIMCMQKEQELLDKYFGGIVEEAASVRPETIDGYPKDLPLKIEEEFRRYLSEVWKDYSDAPLVLEEEKLRALMTEDNREAIDEAYKHARRRSLRERLTKTNHEDVAHYKSLLYEYAKELLMIMRIDFLEELTGHHINCKSFE